MVKLDEIRSRKLYDMVSSDAYFDSVAYESWPTVHWWTDEEAPGLMIQFKITGYWLKSGNMARGYADPDFYGALYRIRRLPYVKTVVEHARPDTGGNASAHIYFKEEFDMDKLIGVYDTGVMDSFSEFEKTDNMG